MWQFIIPAVIGAGASILGSSQQASAAKKGAQASQYATDQQVAVQRDIYNQNRADQEPFRQVGLQALNPLLQGYGITQEKDYAAFVRNNPDVLENFQKYGAPNGMSEVEFGQWFDTNFPGRDIPTNQRVSERYGPEIAPRPEMGQRPQYDAPDLSENAFMGSGAAKYAMREGERAIMANQATRGLLNSGSTVKALQDRAMGIASQDYGDWRNFQQNAFMDRRNTGSRNYEYDLEKRDARFDADRAYATGRFDTRQGGLSMLAGFGTGANAQNAASGANFANAYGNALSSNAVRQGNAFAAQGDAWAQGIQGVSNAAQWGIGAYGKQKGWYG